MRRARNCLARIKAGPGAFTYEIALATFDLAQGKADDSIKLLQQLIARASSTEETLAAKNTLANIYLGQNNVAAAEPLVTEILRADAKQHQRPAAARGDSPRARPDRRRDRRPAQRAQRAAQLARAPGQLWRRPMSAMARSSSPARPIFDAMKASEFSPPIGLAYVAFLQRRGATQQIEGVLTDLATRNPNSVPVLSALARVKLARQDWVGAHALADAIQRLDNKSDVADEINAAAFSGQGKVADSLAVLQNSYSAHPGAVRPMVDLVNVYVQSGQLNEAETFMRSVLTDNPANAEALVLMGSVQLAKKAPAEAEKYFKSGDREKARRCRRLPGACRSLRAAKEDR